MSLEYNNIPKKCFGKNILEIGISTGKRAFLSTNKQFFEESNLTGIDISNQIDLIPELVKKESNGTYNFLNINILDLPFDSFTNQYDTILLIECLEHVDVRKWNSLIKKLKNWLVNDGYLVITTPYKEKMDHCFRIYTPEQIDHCVFGIDEKLMDYFLPGSQFKKMNKWAFREEGESIIRATARFFNRIRKGSYFVNHYLPRRIKLLSVYKKDE